MSSDDKIKAWTLNNFSFTPDSGCDSVKNAFQIAMQSTGNQNSLSKPQSQLPAWNNLAALSATQRLLVASSSNLSGIYATKAKERTFADTKSVLGDLLPPPPSLPTVATPMKPPSNIPLSKSPTSSTSQLQLFKDRSSSDNKPRHTSLSNYRNHLTSSTDHNQPLDLSTSKRLPEVDSSRRDHATASNVVKSSTSVTVGQAHPAVRTSSNNILPQVSRDLPNSARNSGLGRDRRQTHLQPEEPGFAKSNRKGNSDLSFLSDFNREYLQKWMYAAQQQQQQLVVAAQQMSNSQRKRPRSEDSGSGPLRKRSPLNPSPAPSQRHPSTGTSSSSRGTPEFTPTSGSVSGGVTANNNGKRYKRYAKPPYSYVALITLAILSSSEKKLRLSEILKRISEMFPFFKGAYQGWRDSVRHNLSQNECFVKVLKNPYRPTAKGNYWTVNTETIPRDLMTRQNTLVSRFVQESGFNYRKDLTEVFDHENGDIKIEVPLHLQNGAHLIADPALVMETLLLEPKVDDDSARPPIANLSNDHSFSLIHLFSTDDVADDDARYANGCKWYEKTVRARRNFSASKTPQFSPPLPSISSPSVIQQHQEQQVNSRDFVMKMLNNASRAIHSPDAATVANQSDALTQGKSTAFPVVLNVYNNRLSGVSNANALLPVSLPTTSTGFQHIALNRNVAPPAEVGGFEIRTPDKTNTQISSPESYLANADETQRQVLASLAMAASSPRGIKSTGVANYVNTDNAHKLQISMPAGAFLLCQNTSSGL